jgi:hypothetical protein
LDEQNEKRKIVDLNQRTKILEILNQGTENFSEQDHLVLAQPSTSDPELYWKSFGEFLFFTAEIAARKANFSGDSLLKLFDEAKPFLLKITDFSNPSIPFDQIMHNVVTRDLTEARLAATKLAEMKIREQISGFSNTILRNGLTKEFVDDRISNCLNDFILKSQEAFPHILNYLPNETEKHRQELRNVIQTTCNQLFVKQCFAKLLPQIQFEAFETIKENIPNEMKAINIANVGVFNFTSLSTQYETRIESQFQNMTSQIHKDIPSSPEFGEFLSRLRTNVREYVQEFESRRKQEYLAFVEAERKRAAEEAERKHQEELAREQQRKEAERQRLEAEHQAAIRAREAEEKRAAQERAEQQARHQAELDRIRREQEAERQRQEREAQLQREQLEQIRRDQERAAWERERRLREERQAAARRQAELEYRLRTVPPPRVIYEEHSSGFCQVA